MIETASLTPEMPWARNQGDRKSSSLGSRFSFATNGAGIEI
jgi:hypothetical protein